MTGAVLLALLVALLLGVFLQLTGRPAPAVDDDPVLPARRHSRG